MQTQADQENELSRFRLPVSGRVVSLLHSSGAEDLLLVEAPRTPGGDAALALALAERLARPHARRGAAPIGAVHQSPIWMCW